MADSCEWIFYLFGGHHCKSRIFERMENFQNDCCSSWTKKPFKNSYSRQLRIVNAVVCSSPAGQIDWPKSVFLQDKVTLFETMMTTMNEANRDKTKIPDNFFLMFPLSVLLLNSMSKLIHNRCTCKLVIKTLRLQTCMQTETNNCVPFYVLIRYSLLFSSEIILKQLFASGSVNIVDYSTIFTYSTIFISPSANNC